MSKIKKMCISCGKNEAVRCKVDGVVTLCEACYRQRLRKGVSKGAVDASNDLMALAVKATKESAVNIYEDITMEDMMKSVIKTSITKINGNETIVVEGDPLTFFNKKTDEYNMMNGDYEMIKKVSGFRLSDVVDSKYLAQVLILSESINENNEVVCREGIAIGESLKGMPPAIDSQIERMLGYSPKSRRYKECIEHLLAVGVLFEFKVRDSLAMSIDKIYYFNPVYQNSGKGVSPRLFFMFFNSFQQMAQKNKEFRFRFQQMAKFAFTWMMHKRADFKELQVKYNRHEVSEVEIAKGVTNIFAEIADSYNVPVRLKAENVDKSSCNSLLESIQANNISYANINKLEVKYNSTKDLEEVMEYRTENDGELIASVFGYNDEPIAVTTTIKTKRTVTVDGREIPVPTNMPKSLPKVNFNTISDLPAPKPIVNDFGFEEEDTYSYLQGII